MPSSGSGAKSFSLLTNKLAFVLEWLHPSSPSPRLLEKLEENSQWNKGDMQLDGSQVEPRGIGVDWRKKIVFWYWSLHFHSKFREVKHPDGSKYSSFTPADNSTSIFFLGGGGSLNKEHQTWSIQTWSSFPWRMFWEQKNHFFYDFFFFFCHLSETVRCHHVYIRTRITSFSVSSLGHKWRFDWDQNVWLKTFLCVWLDGQCDSALTAMAS